MAPCLGARRLWTYHSVTNRSIALETNGMAGQDVAGRLRFAVLGPVRAWRDGNELDLGTPLQRSILGMLLLREGRAVTPTEMIDAVWGEEAPPRALGALR